MADAKKSMAVNQKEKPPEKQNSQGILKVIVVVIILIMLASIGFGIGIYLKVIDVDNMLNNVKAGKNPFEKPHSLATNFEPVELGGGQVDLSKNNVPPTTNINNPTNQQPLPQMIGQAGTLSDSKVKKQLTVEEKEAAKGIAKMARMYSEMKPEEAAGILQNLDDRTLVSILQKMEEENAAQVLAVFDSRRAAQITSLMLQHSTGVTSN